MEDLLKKANVQREQLKKFINKTAAEELTNLSEPCYLPPFVVDFNKILYLSGLTKIDIQEFVKRFYPPQLSKELILRDPGTNSVLFLMHYFLLQKDEVSIIKTNYGHIEEHKLSNGQNYNIVFVRI